jgi:Putative zinc-finger
MAKAMTHADAASTRAVERYLLGELSPGERDDFEAHAFDCVECAADLQDAATFLDATRAVLREDPLAMARSAGSSEPRVRERASWLAWVNPTPAFSTSMFASAFVLLLGFTLYQNVVILPALRNSSAPRALTAFSFVSSGTRGATPMDITAPSRQPFLLFFDIPPGGQYASYHCAIVAADGTPELAVDVSASEARDTVQLFVPASRLAAGTHALVITGDTTSAQTGSAQTGSGAEAKREIARYPFVLHGGS